MLYDDHENYHQYQLVCHWLQCTGKLPSCLVGLVGQVASSVQMEISNNFIFISFKIADLYDSYRLIWLPQKSFVGEWYPHSSLHIFDINVQASACVYNFREAVVTQGSSSLLRCVFKVYRIVPLASIIPLPVGTRVPPWNEALS